MAQGKASAAYRLPSAREHRAKTLAGMQLAVALVRLDALRLRLIADGADDRAIIAEAEERTIATRYEQLRRMAGFPQRTTTGRNLQ